MDDLNDAEFGEIDPDEWFLRASGAILDLATAGGSFDYLDVFELAGPPRLSALTGMTEKRRRTP